MRRMLDSIDIGLLRWKMVQGLIADLEQASRRIAGAHKDPNSTTDLRVFDGRSHYICGEEGWEEVADYVLNWIEQL